MSDESEAGEGRQVPAADAAGDAVDGVVDGRRRVGDADDRCRQVSLAKSVRRRQRRSTESRRQRIGRIGGRSASPPSSVRLRPVRPGQRPVDRAFGPVSPRPRVLATKPRDSGREVRAELLRPVASVPARGRRRAAEGHLAGSQPDGHLHHRRDRLRRFHGRAHRRPGRVVRQGRAGGLRLIRFRSVVPDSATFDQVSQLSGRSPRCQRSPCSLSIQMRK